MLSGYRIPKKPRMSDPMILSPGTCCGPRPWDLIQFGLGVSTSPDPISCAPQETHSFSWGGVVQLEGWLAGTSPAHVHMSFRALSGVCPASISAAIVPRFRPNKKEGAAFAWERQNYKMRRTRVREWPHRWHLPGNILIQLWHKHCTKPLVVQYLSTTMAYPSSHIRRSRKRNVIPKRS